MKKVAGNWGTKMGCPVIGYPTLYINIYTEIFHKVVIYIFIQILRVDSTLSAMFLALVARGSNSLAFYDMLTKFGVLTSHTTHITNHVNFTDDVIIYSDYVIKS